MARLPVGYRQRKDGKIECRFVIDGKRYSCYADNVKECREKERELREKIAEGLYTMECPPREYRISQENALILRDMLECDVRYLGEIGLNRHQRVDFLAALLAYYSYHLDTINSVQSIRILQEVF